MYGSIIRGKSSDTLRCSQCSYTDFATDCEVSGQQTYNESSLRTSNLQGPASSEEHIKAVLSGLEFAQVSIADAIRTIQQQMVKQTESQPVSQLAGQMEVQFGREVGSQSMGSSTTGCPTQGGEWRTSQDSGVISARVNHESYSSSQRRATVRQFRDDTSTVTAVASGTEAVGGSVPRLPLNWPSVLAVRKIAQDSDQSMREPRFSLSRLGCRSINSKTSEDPVVVDAKKRTCARCIREPDSAMDQIYNVGGFLILLCDLSVMPVVLAWDLPFEGVLVVQAWLSLIFWLSDLVLCFFTGFFEEGELNMDVNAATRRYLRSWFVPDFLVVSCDLFSIIMLTFIGSERSSGVGLRFARFAKLGRLLRIMGLVRAFRATRALEAMVERNLSELQRTFLRVMAIAIGWLWMNHILACVWYAVGRYAPSDTGARWVEQAYLTDFEDFQYAHAGRVFQYASAIHWAIAQTTLGAMEVASVNTAERIVNVGCLLIGLFFGSSLISSMSAGMVEFRMSGRIRSNMMSTLRRYLLENNVNKKVALSVQRQAAARLSDTAMLTAKDVPALATLATGIRDTLHSEICQPHLQKHQLFQLWQHIDCQWFQQFCSKAVELKFLRPEDDLFLPGSESVATFFIICGEMEYTQKPESSPVLVLTKRIVEHNAWLSESTLWVHWIHVGKMEATTRCQVLAIQVDGVAHAMLEHYTIRALATDYGRIFAERVVSAKPPRLPWPHDLSVPFADFGDVVVALPTELHVTIGSVALSHCKNRPLRPWKTSQAKNDLRQEIEDGRSIVILSLAGEIERVVSLAAIHIVRGDGRVLVQLAKWQKLQALPDVQLPAVKCRGNESSDEAVQRLLLTDLAPLAEGLELLGTERESSERDSARFGVRTHYMRKLFYAKFNAPATWRPAPLSDARATASVPNLEVFDSVNVHFIRHDAGGMFCAWLRESDIPHLKTLNHSTPVRRWLLSLSPPDVSRV